MTSGQTQQHQIYIDIDDLVALGQTVQQIPPRAVNQINPGIHQAKFRGRGLDFEELKPYRSGDDVRLINWRLTQRTGKPYVSVFNEEKEHGLCLLVDQRMDMFFASRGSMKSVVAAKCAALLGWQAIGQQDKVSLDIFSDNKIDIVKFGRGANVWLQRLKTLVDFNQALVAGNTADASQINIALQALLGAKHHEQRIFIISDFVGLTEVGEAAITELARHNEVCLIHVYDQLEATLPKLGVLPLTDGQHQYHINTGQKAINQAVCDSFDQAKRRLLALAEQGQARRIFNVSLNVAEDLITQLSGAGLMHLRTGAQV